MSNLQLVEALCAVVEQQSEIIRRLASELEQVNALSAEDKALLDEVADRYSSILGADEVP